MCGQVHLVSGQTTTSPLRLCNITNPRDSPALGVNCTYCYVGTDVGCSNGGTCYVPTGSRFPICGCFWGWTGLTCATVQPLRRICDPLNATDRPPLCQYCYPDRAPGSNGCYSYGFCSIQNIQNASLPPNTQQPICTCQSGMTAPQCFLNFYQLYGRTDVIVYRWIYVAAFGVVMALCALVIAQHLYFGISYRFIFSNIMKMVGAILLFFAAMNALLQQALNPLGAVLGFPTEYLVMTGRLTSNLMLAFLGTCIAICTSNWLWIGLAAITPMHRAKDTWPAPAVALSIAVPLILFPLAVFFAVFQVQQNVWRIYVYICAAFYFVMLLFSIIAGVFVLLTIRVIEGYDPALLRRTTIQLILCSFGELIGITCLLIIGGLPDSAYGNFNNAYGVAVIFSVLAQLLLMLMLLIQFRIAVWQLKEMAMDKPNTIDSKTGAAGKQDLISHDSAVSDISPDSSTNKLNLDDLDAQRLEREIQQQIEEGAIDL